MVLLDLAVGTWMMTDLNRQMQWHDKFEGDSVYFATFQCFLACVVMDRQRHVKEGVSQSCAGHRDGRIHILHFHLHTPYHVMSAGKDIKIDMVFYLEGR